MKKILLLAGVCSFIFPACKPRHDQAVVHYNKGSATQGPKSTRKITAGES